MLGNQSLLGSDWLAPAAISGNSIMVSLWMIQRDERYGVSIFDCLLYTSDAADE